MDGNVIRLLSLLVTLSFAEYHDDSDYNDFEFYENLPTSYERSANENDGASGPEDFYLISDSDNAEGDWNFGMDKIPKDSQSDKADVKLASMSNQRERNWYKSPEKIYRYTKHRIPGYDYDELDFMSSRGYQQCDDRSVWTNCVCQFTCQDPSVVDCFTPCRNGCECKEDYVFDEKTGRCILPEECNDNKDYLLYKK